MALAYDRFDGLTRAAAYAEYLASIAVFRTEKGYRIPCEIMRCRGWKPD